jgi:hypothetical protein
MSPMPAAPPVAPRFERASRVDTMYSWVPTNSLSRTGTTSGNQFALDVLFPNAQSALTELFSVDPLFSRFAFAVLALRVKDGDEPEEDAAATAYAVSQAFYLVPQSRLSLSQAWRPPFLVTDGYGGIRMTWANRGRDVRVSVPGNDSGKRMLYWEEGDAYGSVHDVTPTTLTKYLRWMTNVSSSVSQ